MRTRFEDLSCVYNVNSVCVCVCVCVYVCVCINNRLCVKVTYILKIYLQLHDDQHVSLSLPLLRRPSSPVLQIYAEVVLLPPQLISQGHDPTQVFASKQYCSPR